MKYHCTLFLQAKSAKGMASQLFLVRHFDILSFVWIGNNVIELSKQQVLFFAQV